MHAQTQLRPDKSVLESQQPHTSSGRVGDGEELRVCVGGGLKHSRSHPPVQ